MLSLPLQPSREVPKLDFQSEFPMSKISWFFSLKNKNFEAQWFFDNFKFESTFLQKSVLIFDKAAKLGKPSWDAYNQNS
jgi:hypothetical protein